jgi:hypothetical protein
MKIPPSGRAAGSRRQKIFILEGGCITNHAGLAYTCTGETPVPPKKLGEKYSIGRNPV